MYLCGVPMGGIPLSTTYKYDYFKTSNTFKVMIKKHTELVNVLRVHENIENNTRNVVLIEDVVTTGSSVKEAIDMSI